MDHDTCICENIKFLESIADASVTDCHKMKIVTDIIATKKTNTMAATMTNSIATNEDFDLDNIFKDKKSHENILIYDISYKTLINLKPLHIRFDKIDGFIWIYDGTRYLTLFASEKHDVIYDKIRYLISLEISITYIFSHYFAKIKAGS